MRFRSVVITGILLALPVVVAAQPMRKVYLDPNSSFSAFFAAALQKKKVPVTVTVDPRRADYMAHFQVNNSHGSVIEGVTREMNNGLYNSGASGRVTLTIVDRKSKDVVFSYTCRKPSRFNANDPSVTSSVAECLAKHWKSAMQ